MFPVRNAQRTLRRLKRLGVQVGDLVEVPGVMIIGTFYDPDGNPHHLVQSLRPKAPRRRRASEGSEVAPTEPQP